MLHRCGIIIIIIIIIVVFVVVVLLLKCGALDEAWWTLKK